MAVRIREIRGSDFDAVLEINAEATPAVARLDKTELRRLTGIASVAWVAEDAGKVTAYLLAMSSDDAYDGEEYEFFRTKLSEPFLYVDQVAVASNARRASVGSLLYGRLTQWAQLHGIRIQCCEVNLRPANPISLRFHEKIGFKSMEELKTRDGRCVTLLCKASLPEGLA